MKPRRILFPALQIPLFFLLASPDSEARMFRRDMLPHARDVPNEFVSVSGCVTCHFHPDPEDDLPETHDRNPFGMAVEMLVSEDGEEPFWGAMLAALDSDGDGVPNGVELQDPTGLGLHMKADPPIPPDENFPLGIFNRRSDLQVGDPDLVSNPGDPNSVPPGSMSDTPTPTLPAATPTPTATSTAIPPTATNSPPAPTSTHTPPLATETSTGTSEPTSSHTSLQTATPSRTSTLGSTPSPTSTPEGAEPTLNRDEDPKLDTRDLLVHLLENRSALQGENFWFRVALEWNESE